VTYVILPSPDRDSAAWWAALDRHELILQCCSNCGRLRWPAREICNHCRHAESNWVSATGRGTVVSWTVSHRASPGVEVPFVVVMVRVDDQDDIYLPGHYDGPQDGWGLWLGAPVEVGFEEIGDDEAAPATLLRWRLA
jgi:uncharacterized OB-fold protein